MASFGNVTFGSKLNNAAQASIWAHGPILRKGMKCEIAFNFFFRFHGKYGSQRNGNVSVNNNEYIYSYPNETQGAVTATLRGGLDNNFINQTEVHSDLHSTNCNELIETRLNNEYTLIDNNGEYDVLRSKRENLDISVDGNIYDRTNNLVSGIYDSTVRRIESKE